VVLDLVGREQREPGAQRILTPLFNSVPGDAGALLAALDGGPLRVEVSDSAEELEPLAAQPAMSDRRVLTKALDNVLSCTIELILKAIDACTQAALVQNPVRERPARRSAPSGVQSLAFVTRTLAVKAQKFLGMLLHGGDSWAVAWRLHTRTVSAFFRMTGVAITPIRSPIVATASDSSSSRSLNSLRNEAAYRWRVLAGTERFQLRVLL